MHTDEFTVRIDSDEFVIKFEQDDWRIFVKSHSEYKIFYETVGLNETAFVLQAAEQVEHYKDLAFGYSQQTAADAISTAGDRAAVEVASEAAVDAAVSTAADRVQTGLDAAATAADRVQTGTDADTAANAAIATAADVVATAADAAATAADRVQTGLDVTSTGNDAAAATAAAASSAADAVATASDRVQTGLDATATAADRVQTGLDAAATAADRVQTAADRVQTGLDKAATAADRVQTGLDAAATAVAVSGRLGTAAVALTGNDANNATQNGWYIVDGATLNTPVAFTGVLFVEVYNTNNIIQTYKRTSSSATYTRRRAAGVWSAWDTITPATTTTPLPINRGGTGGTGGALTPANNLSDVASPHVARGNLKAKGTVLIGDQDGASAYDKFMNALSVSKPGDTISSAGYVGELNPGNGTAIVPALLGDRTYDLGGITIKPSVDAAYCLQVQEGVSDITIKNMTMDCNNRGGLNFIGGSQRVSIISPRMRNFAPYAIAARSKGLLRLQDFEIINPIMDKPAAGVSHPIIVTSATDTGLPAYNVYVRGGNMFGVDMNEVNPDLEDYTGVNAYTADYITFQGVFYGFVEQCRVAYSGSAGVTAARNCKWIVVDGCTFDMCYEPGINPGAGNEMVHVDNIAGFTVGVTDTMRSTAAGIAAGPGPGASNQLEAVYPDPTGPGGWLVIYAVYGGFAPKLGDDIWQEGFVASPGATITAAPADAVMPGMAAIGAVEDMKMFNNILNDVTIQGAAAAIQANRCRGESYAFNNRVSNPRGIGNPQRVLNNATGRIGYDSNFWNGELAQASQYQMFGNSSWAFMGAVRPPELLDGWGPKLTIAAGVLTPTHKYHQIDTEAAAASDALTRIDWTNASDGEEVTFRTFTNTRDVTIGNGTYIGMGATGITLDTTNATVTFAADKAQNAGLGKSYLRAHYGAG